MTIKIISLVLIGWSLSAGLPEVLASARIATTVDGQNIEGGLNNARHQFDYQEHFFLDSKKKGPSTVEFRFCSVEPLSQATMRAANSLGVFEPILEITSHESAEEACGDLKFVSIFEGRFEGIPFGEYVVELSFPLGLGLETVSRVYELGTIIGSSIERDLTASGPNYASDSSGCGRMHARFTFVQNIWFSVLFFCLMGLLVVLRRHSRLNT